MLGKANKVSGRLFIIPTFWTLILSDCMTPLFPSSYFKFQTSALYLGIIVVLAPKSIIELWSNLSLTIRVKKKGLGFGLPSLMMETSWEPSFVSTIGVQDWSPLTDPPYFVCNSGITHSTDILLSPSSASCCSQILISQIPSVRKFKASVAYGEKNKKIELQNNI